MARFLIVLLVLWAGQVFWVPAISAGQRADTHSVSLVNRGVDHHSAGKSLEGPMTRELTPEMLKRTVQKYLEGVWREKVKTVSVTVLDPLEPIQLASGVIELQVIPTGSEETLGRRSFEVAVMANGKPWKTILVWADVVAMIDAIVPARFLKMDELIDIGDIKTARIRVYQLNHPFVTDRDEVIGKSTARPLPPDTPMRPPFVKAPLLIKKGDRVMIEARHGGFSIQTYGITKSSGQLGQTIMVANLDSGRELRAKVVAPSLVQVEF